MPISEKHWLHFMKVLVMESGIGLCSNNKGDTFAKVGSECICVYRHACEQIFVNTRTHIHCVHSCHWQNYLHCACGICEEQQKELLLRESLVTQNRQTTNTCGEIVMNGVCHAR